MLPSFLCGFSLLQGRIRSDNSMLRIPFWPSQGQCNRLGLPRRYPQCPSTAETPGLEEGKEEREGIWALSSLTGIMTNQNA